MKIDKMYNNLTMEGQKGFLQIVKEIKKENSIKEIKVIGYYAEFPFYKDDVIEIILHNDKKIYIGYNQKIDSYIFNGIYNYRCINLSQYYKLNTILKVVNTTIKEYDNIYNYTIKKLENKKIYNFSLV